MAELKTTPSNANALDFLQGLNDAQKRNDCLEIMHMMQQATGEPPIMWGTSIIGFGSYHYVYASGREGDWMRIGFSPRKENIALYFMSGVEHHQDLLDKIGKYKMGKSCFYIKKLADVDHKILQELIHASLTKLKEMYG
jgi:hypothetical protein